MTQSWREGAVGPACTAEKALQVLDQAGLRMVLVVDAADRLLGVMTDGDVRRALLRRVDFAATPVSDVMQRHPVTAVIDTPRDALIALMEKHSILHIPILDREGRLQRLETYQHLSHPTQRENWVFLMAGGFGKRLAPLTNDRPKPMLSVGGKPMLETILDGFIAAGFNRFYISVFYLAEQIKAHFGDGSKWNVTIRYVEESEPLGTGGALGLLPDIANLPLIMMNGDIITQLDYNAMLEFHERQAGEITMGVRIYEMQVPFGVVEGSDFRVSGIVEKPSHRFMVNAGVYVVSPQFVARAQPLRRVDMPELVQNVLDAQNTVSMFPIHESWLDVGRHEDFERAQIEPQ